ncbi:hypothetical protein EP7_002166 [Isosphaeraceae bacterium EP7]
MIGLKKYVFAFGLVLALNATSSAQLMISVGGGNPYGYSNGVIGGRGYAYPGYTQGYAPVYGYGNQGYVQQQTTVYPGGTTYYSSGYSGYAPTVVAPGGVYSTATPYANYYRPPVYGYRPGFNPYRGYRRW